MDKRSVYGSVASRRYANFRFRTVFPVIEAWSQIQAGSLIQAGGQTSFVLMEAGPLIEAGGLNSYIIELGPNCTSPGSTVVHYVIRAYCVISRKAVWPT